MPFDNLSDDERKIIIAILDGVESGNYQRVFHAEDRDVTGIWNINILSHGQGDMKALGKFEQRHFDSLRQMNYIQPTGKEARGYYILSLTDKAIQEYRSYKKSSTAQQNANSVFIVHGRNHVVRDKIDLFIIKELGIHTVVMEGGAHQGRTLPEKFEETARKCSFAVFILTGDDKLVDVDSNRILRRARQNVVLEIGYFWGLLGRRGKVAFLVDNDPEMELPSDIQGMGWIPITDDLAETKLRLRRELAAAGLIP